MFKKKNAKRESTCEQDRARLNERLDDTSRKLDDVLERLRKGAERVAEKRRLKVAP